MRQPVLEAGIDLRRGQRLADLDVVRRGGQHHAAAAHQELVDREALLVIERLRPEHQQQVDIVRDPAILQIEVAGAHAFTQCGVELRVARPAAARVELRRRLVFRLDHRHRLQEARRHALQCRGDRPLQRILVQRFRQRHLDARRVALALQHHVEPERLRIDEAGDLRTEAVALFQLPGQRAAVGVRVLEAHFQLVTGLLLQVLDDLAQFASQLAQIARQARIGRQVADETDRLCQLLERVAAGLIAVDHLADRPRDAVLRVLQPHVQIALAAGLHFNQIAEAELLVLVAVGNDDVEVRVDDRRLVARRSLERHRPHVILRRRFVLRFAIAGRVDELDAGPAAGGHRVLLQQVLHLWHQRCQQRMGLRREIAADHQRLAQLVELLAGRVGQRIQPVVRDVGAHRADRCQPQVGHDEVRCRQPGHQRDAAMPAAGRVAGPAQLLQPVQVQRQKHADDRHVVVQVAQVEHATGDRFEAGADTELGQHAANLMAEQRDQQVRADHVEQPADQRRQDQRDDRVVGAAAHRQADGDIGRRQEQRRDIAADHRPDIERPEQRHGDRQRQGQRQRHGHQRQTAAELAEHQCQRRHRRGQQRFQRAGAAFLRPRPHGQRRNQEDQQQRQPLEQRPHVGQVAGEERFQPEEREQRDAQKRTEEQIGRRCREEAAELLGGDAPHIGGQTAVMTALMTAVIDGLRHGRLPPVRRSGSLRRRPRGAGH